jgi:hypothetical protein
MGRCRSSSGPLSREGCLEEIRAKNEKELGLKRQRRRRRKSQIGAVEALIVALPLLCGEVVSDAE